MQTETKTKIASDQTYEPELQLEAIPQRMPAARAPKQAAPVANPMSMIAAASARGASAEELGKLMDLLERHQDREAAQAFARAMVAFKLRVPTILKDAGAAFTAKGASVAYDYATLGHICESIIAVLAECGISHNWKPEQPRKGDDAGWIIMTCVLTHELGFKESATFKFPADPTGTKNDLQAIGSSATYGERYSLLAVCGIAVKQQGDDDGAGATPRAKEVASRRSPAAVAAGNAGKATPASNQLLTNARAAADKGHAHFGPFFKECTEQQRKALAGEMADLTERANKAGK